MVPGLTPARTPVGPPNTSAVALPSASIVTTMSAAAAAAAGDSAAVAHGLDERRDRFVPAVPHDNRESGGNEVVRDRRSHLSQTEYGNGRRVRTVIGGFRHLRSFRQFVGSGTASKSVDVMRRRLPRCGCLAERALIGTIALRGAHRLRDQPPFHAPASGSSALPAGR